MALNQKDNEINKLTNDLTLLEAKLTQMSTEIASLNKQLTLEKHPVLSKLSPRQDQPKVGSYRSLEDRVNELS
jgi:hypothetical protein